MLTRELIQNYFTNIPTLRTERLIMRKIEQADCADMFDYSSQKAVTRYLLWSPHPTRDYTARYIDYLSERYTAGDFYDWALVPHATGRMVGTCGFTRFDFTNNSAEVGYVLSPSVWGSGYATEALNAVLDVGFRVLGLHRIEARYLAGNVASSHVMARVGMTFEGEFRDAMIVKGRYESVGVFSILRDEYDKRR